MKVVSMCLIKVCFILFAVLLVIDADQEKEEMDKVIEDEITNKLSTDLLQSIERKFQVDLEKAVDAVLMKIKYLLQNGTSHIQDRLMELHSLMDSLRNNSASEVDACLNQKQNETSALAERALHQMVVCGYALIGHDPEKAVKNVMELKGMIKDVLKPIYEQKNEVYSLLKICGHDHDSLKKVIKCVISKSPHIKAAMMDVTGQLLDGVVKLTKMMAHGAMHEACLIEVVKTVEDEAFELIKHIKHCTHGTTSAEEADAYIKENNATVIDINKKPKVNVEMKDLLRRMLESDNKNLDKNKVNKLLMMQKDVGDTNSIATEVLNKD